MGIHDGHRDRLRKRFVEHGLDNFEDLNVLELLLFYCIPRKDTNELAHKLLERFGSFHEVFNASIAELMEVSGISFNAAVFLKLICQIQKRIDISKTSNTKQIIGSKSAGEYILPRLKFERDEVLLMLCLDNSNRIISCKEMNRGTVNAVEVCVRRIAETALSQKAVTVIIAHNHPDGKPMPSIEDEYLTKSIYNALEPLGIKLEDHFIVGMGIYTSLRENGMMHRYST